MRHFFKIVKNEQNAIEMKEKITIWKNVNGSRENCDICETTIFNFHSTCQYCGFVIYVSIVTTNLITISFEWKSGKPVYTNESQIHDFTFTQITTGESMKLLEDLEKNAHILLSVNSQ